MFLNQPAMFGLPELKGEKNPRPRKVSDAPDKMGEAFPRGRAQKKRRDRGQTRQAMELLDSLHLNNESLSWKCGNFCVFVAISEH